MSEPRKRPGRPARPGSPPSGPKLSPSGRYYLRDDGRIEPAGALLPWCEWFETADRKVARTRLLDGSEVSTVFLGLDHSFGMNGPPLLFETCIFYHEDTVPPVPSLFASGKPLHESGIEARYATWAEAEVGHMEIVERLTAALEAHAVPKEVKP